MSAPLWLFLSLALSPAQAEEPVAELTPAQQQMTKALSVRHDPPSCHDLEKLSEEPLADLLVLVNQVQRPSWVGMRAASCVVSRHGAEAEAELVRWVTSPDTLGLARLVANSIDALPPEVAATVATAGLSGMYAEDQRTRLMNSELESVRTLVMPSK